MYRVNANARRNASARTILHACVFGTVFQDGSEVMLHLLAFALVLPLAMFTHENFSHLTLIAFVLPWL